MRRWANAACAAVAVAALTACPPPLRPNPPPAYPWVMTFLVECVDELGGIHYGYTVPADGRWGFQFYQAAVNAWSTPQIVFPATRGQRRTVVTHLPFRLVYFQTVNEVIQPSRVASPPVQPRPIDRACP